MSEQLSEYDNMRLSLRSAGETLEEQILFLKDAYKMAELEAFAEMAGVASPAKTKDALAEQIIAIVTSGEEANVDDEADSPNDDAGEDEADSPEDPAEPETGVLSGEGVVRGVSLPAKVAKYRPEQLWPQILGWEVDQGLDEIARSAFTEDELREYLAYLWRVRDLGVKPQNWAKITEYEFRGIEQAE